MLNSNKQQDPHQFVQGILKDLKIDTSHSEQSQAETDYWLSNTGLDDTKLTDLTDIPFVTIDNEDSKDLDQALYISETKSGYQVLYALADAAYYIRPGSALFTEALQRGTTFYTPLMAAAMLPTPLSEGLISLNPNVHRRALVFDMQLGSDAAVLSCSIVRAKMCSQAKLNYPGVQHWLDTTSDNTEPYHQSLRLLKEVGEKLIIAGEQRGIVGFNRTATHIELEGQPPQFRVTVRERVATERYNEQMSLICNMQGAQMLLGLSGITDVLQAVYRVHEAPLKKSLKQLKSTLNEFADSFSDRDDAAKWHWHEGQSLADYVAKLPTEPEHQRQVGAIQRQIMQAQRGSRFTPEPGEHHALKASSYARFSSPMREVVGIFTHKELLEALDGNHLNDAADHELREQVIEAANSARQKQRQLDKKIQLATLQRIFLAELDVQQPHWHQGTIMGLRTDKLYVQLDDMALDIKIYVDDLNETFNTEYTVGNTKAKASDPLAPSWVLGDGVQLSVQAYDEARSRFVFDLRALT